MIFFRIPQKITGENYIDCYRGKRQNQFLKPFCLLFIFGTYQNAIRTSGLLGSLAQLVRATGS